MGIINYTKIFLWSSLYYFQKEKSDIIFKIIIKNIKESGCVTIKFIQWILPKLEAIYDIDKNNPEHKWFCDLEEVYENINFACQANAKMSNNHEIRVGFLRNFFWLR